LAIDLRGHGESEMGPRGFQIFSNKDHQASIEDVEVAVNFFVGQGLPLKKIILIGASIGANLALQFQSEHPEIKTSILLSPGLNYRGVETELVAKKINENQAVFITAGGETDEYSTETAQMLFNMLKSKNKKLKIIENAGHGTEILNSQRFLINEIILWIQSLN
jgi:alpha-beta hydrolase superfamily lysophospholipase